jgi:putative transposase
VARQCELLGISRSGLYYLPQGENAYNQQLMHLIDEQYTRTPFFGVPWMTQWLRRQGHEVNRKRVSRLMQQMGLQAIYPKPRLSEPHPEHRIYPYLLQDVVPERPHQVWSTDITYVRLAQGFVYLVAILDWFSRYALAWELSITMEMDFCLKALETALQQGKPEIFNSDQGSQFTSLAFTERLAKEGIQISMDGRGRVFDNIFVERLWRSLKWEEVYLNDYRNVREAKQGISQWFHFYNHERPHQSLDYRTPYEVHFQ